MPIERYVINFLQEVPLPPPGRVDIRYFMPNNFKFLISRPPPNKLPMVDFSYRPLFTCLSVENIILVFQCLCAELTVCICSDILALLTPVQEAFLSFLFPLVWQGKELCCIVLNFIGSRRIIMLCCVLCVAYCIVLCCILLYTVLYRVLHLFND